MKGLLVNRGTHSYLVLTLALLSSLAAGGEEFWNGAVSYRPPFHMFVKSQPATAPGNLEDWQFYTLTSNTNGLAEVTFHVDSLESFLGPDTPDTPIHNTSELKQFMDSKLASEPTGTNYTTRLTEIDGRPALLSLAKTNRIPQGPSQWYCGACFFCESNSVWQKSTVCAITIAAQRRETLYALTNSLKTIKVQRVPKRN